jgi:hypothetical protein
MSTGNSTVTYREIPDYAGYRVGSDGSVWTRLKLAHYGPGNGRGTRAVVGESWRRMKPTTRGNRGYSLVTLHRQGRRKGMLVHRLVLLAFVGEPPDGTEACHGDGNRANNALANLRWDTRTSNHADKHKHGTDRLGEKTPTSKLTAATVLEIRARYAAGGITQRRLAAEYGIHFSNVSAIINRKSWAHLD